MEALQKQEETNRQIRQELGCKIKSYMVEFNKTQYEFAKLSGLSRVIINDLINNRNTFYIIRATTIDKLNSILKGSHAAREEKRISEELRKEKQNC